ncbi:MAG: NRDE family protein [Sphingorhabdus sp.]
MCVVAIAWEAHPRWRLLVAGNRDELHTRPSAPVARWQDQSDIIAGRDLVSKGTWMGVSDSGRFAVVTNIRNADGPDPDKKSRGDLVADWLHSGHVTDELGDFNPFNLIVTGHQSAELLSNRPMPLRQPMQPGIHGLSNAIPDEHWPRTDRLVAEISDWLTGPAADLQELFGLLIDETIPDPDAIPVFIRSPIYGTRCSTVIAVDRQGQGQIIERRFGPDGEPGGQTKIDFVWAI